MLEAEPEKQSLEYEYDLFRRSKLFTEEENKEIMKTRKNFQYRIEKQLKSMRDYLEYIKFERDLLTRINERRKTQKLSNRSLEQSVASKILKLYKSALAKYPEESRLYENFLKFCRICKCKSDVQPYLVQWTKNHGKDPGVWVKVIMWEYEELHDINRVRTTVTQALCIHPSHQELYLILFKFELTEASKQCNSRGLDGNKESLQSLAMKRAEDLYIYSKKNIYDIDFIIKALHIAEEFPFSRRLQNSLIKEMMTHFPGSEKTWHELAQRELKGYSVKDISTVSDENKIIECNELSSIKLTSDLNADIDKKDILASEKRIEVCVKIYNKAAQIIKSETMWTYYIDAMIDLNKDQSTQQNLKRKCLLIAYRGAHEASALTEEQYLQYIDLLKITPYEDDNGHLLIAVLRRATTIFYDSIELWKLYLKYYIQRNEEHAVEEIFRHALKILKPHTLPLWQMVKQYMFIKYATDDWKKVNAMFWEAVTEPEPVASVFKAEYIEWTALVRGIDSARNLFNELLAQKWPPCYKMHRTMIRLNTQLLSNEHHQPNTDNIDAAKKCFEISLEYFGHSEPDLWIEYIKFERDYGETKNISYLHYRAKQTLDQNQLEAFLSQYDLINIIL